MNCVIRVKEACVSFGKHRVLDSLTLSLEQGTIVGLVGPNGAGKTTLLRTMSGLVPGYECCVGFANQSNDKHENFKRNIFFLESVDVLDMRLSGLDYLVYIKKQWKSKRSIEKVVKLLGINAFLKRPLRKLSLGMKQQIMLSLAFISGAPIILLDEPMNALDPSNAALISGLLKKLRCQGATVMLSTHLLYNIDELADQVLFLKDGRIALIKDANSRQTSAETYRALYLSDNTDECWAQTRIQTNTVVHLPKEH